MVLVISSNSDLVDQIHLAVRGRAELFVTASVGVARQAFLRNPLKWLAVAVDFSESEEERVKLVARFARVQQGAVIIALVQAGQVELGFELAHHGVDLCIPTPTSTRRIATALHAAVAAISRFPSGLPAGEQERINAALVPLVGSSEAVQELRSRVVRAARGDVPVLVTGETGSGKQIVSQVIHNLSDRRGGPFVDVNVCAIAESLFEAELFGSVPGAFTGAVRRDGFFQSAHGGTLFLDEIGDLPPALQPKILKAVEARQVRPLGQGSPIAVDVRVVTATNRNLEARVRCGSFREDLWHRLAGIVVAVPPLRERLEDIKPLCRAILQDSPFRHLTLRPDAIRALQHHRWLGNVRELRTVLERSAIQLSGASISARDLVFDRTLR